MADKPAAKPGAPGQKTAPKKVVHPLIKKFKQDVLKKEGVQETILTAMKSPNSKVRTVAVKYAILTQDRKWVNKHVAPILEKETSKKVTRVLAHKLCTETAIKKHESVDRKVKEALAAQKKAAEAATAEAAAPAKA